MARVILNPKSDPLFDNPDFYYGDVDPSRTDWIDRYSLPAVINGEEPFTLNRISDSQMELEFYWQPYRTSRANSSIYADLPNANTAQIREVHLITGKNLLSTNESDWLISAVTLSTQWRLPNNDATIKSYHIASDQADTAVTTDRFYEQEDKVFFSGNDFISGSSGND